MKFGDLKQILSNSRDIVIFDEDGGKRKTYHPCDMDTTYDECEVYMLDIVDGNFKVCVEMPTWAVSGTITVDIQYTVKALDEEEAMERAEDIIIDTSRDGLYIRTVGDIDIDLDYPDTEWDSAEIMM